MTQIYEVAGVSTMREYKAASGSIREIIKAALRHAVNIAEPIVLTINGVDVVIRPTDNAADIDDQWTRNYAFSMGACND